MHAQKILRPWQPSMKRHFKHGGRPLPPPQPIVLAPRPLPPPLPPHPPPPPPPKHEEGEIKGGLGYIFGCLGRRGI